MQQRHNLKTQCTIEIERDEFVDMWTCDMCG
jgi:hypothetical protein